MPEILCLLERMRPADETTWRGSFSGTVLVAAKRNQPFAKRYYASVLPQRDCPGISGMGNVPHVIVAGGRLPSPAIFIFQYFCGFGALVFGGDAGIVSVADLYGQRTKATLSEGVGISGTFGDSPFCSLHFSAGEGGEETSECQAECG